MNSVYMSPYDHDNGSRILRRLQDERRGTEGIIDEV